MLSSIIIRKI